MAGHDLEFWDAVAPLRAEFLSAAYRRASEWAAEPCGTASDAAFVEFSRSVLCLTRIDRHGVLDFARGLVMDHEVSDGSAKVPLLRALTVRIASLEAGTSLD